MHGIARLIHDGRTRGFSLTPLQCAEVAASHYGFYDLDVEPVDSGWKIVASGSKMTKVTVRGDTISEAVDKLVTIFAKDDKQCT